MTKFFELLENYEDNDELIKQLIVVKCNLTDNNVENILQNKSKIKNECAKNVYNNYFNRVYLDEIQNNIVEEEIIIQEENVNQDKGGGASYMLVFIGLILIFFYIYRE